MTQELMSLHYEGKTVETIRHNEETWFLAKDVCDVLGLTNITETLKRLDEEDISTSVVMKSGQRKDMYIVSEFGLYDLILLSRKPEARAFKRWITREVLPQIRTTGMYMPDRNDWYALAEQEYKAAMDSMEQWWRGRYIRKAEYEYLTLGFRNGLSIHTARAMFGISDMQAHQLHGDLQRLIKAEQRLAVFTGRGAIC